jgi:anti-repressor protein
MNELQIFKNEEFGEVRALEIDGDPWFIGKDVAEVLGYTNSRKALADHVDDEDKGVTKCDTLGGSQELTVINESGLYSLILSSKLPSAKKFKRWVTSEVLPAIRKTGGYQIPQTYAEALRRLADESERVERLALENKEMKPKAEFFDAVTDSKTALPIGDVAKVLDMGIGRNKLFQFLREMRILTSDNRPYQEYIDRGYFRVIEQKYDKGYGEVGINIKTLVFQKGVDFIRRKLLEQYEVTV